MLMFIFSWQKSTQPSSIINLSQKSTIPYTRQFSTRTCFSRKSNISKALPITNPRIDPHKQITPTTALPSTQTKPNPQTPNPYPDTRIPQIVCRNSFAIKTVLIKSNQWMDVCMINKISILKKKHNHPVQKPGMYTWQEGCVWLRY